MASAALCSAASKTEKSEKTVSKRGLLELGYGYGAPAYAAQAYASPPQAYAAQAYAAPTQVYAAQAYASPPQAYAAQAYAGQAYASPAHFVAQYQQFQPAAAPQFVASPQLIPDTHTLLPQAHAAPVQAAHALQFANAPAPAVHHEYAPHAVPTQVRTVIKHVHVPYERTIKVDNPIYTTVERQVPVDNPVPVVKYVKQPVAVHVDQPFPIAIVKEVRVSEPYVHKVRVILQQVYVNNHEQPRMGYLPPEQPRSQYLPPAPAAEQHEHMDAPVQQPQSQYIPPPQHIEAPAPQQQHFELPSTSYGVPEQRFSAPAPPSRSYIAPQQQQFSAPEPQGYH